MMDGYGIMPGGYTVRHLVPFETPVLGKAKGRMFHEAFQVNACCFACHAEAPDTINDMEFVNYSAFVFVMSFLENDFSHYDQYRLIADGRWVQQGSGKAKDICFSP